jgi:hypothetical protein
MVQNRPKKVGEYDRPEKSTSTSTGLVIGIIGVIAAVVILAFIFLG